MKKLLYAQNFVSIHPAFQQRYTACMVLQSGGIDALIFERGRDGDRKGWEFKRASG
ncbi:MAG: hypothetical protein NW224_30465 [Leptolyngbyaceae cyanobacterium bins.302]|nr:hypothetical protein [Leptolyngbyaceae cyanobacterium bins.302]